MKAIPSLLSAALLFAIGSQPAWAQDDYNDLDGEETEKKAPTRERKRPEVREIVRGFYAKSNVGGALYLGQFAGVVNPGTMVALGVGQDFLDQERQSAAWEVGFNQGIHNGQSYEEQAAVGGPFVQGDLRTYAFTAVFEYSFYPSRRVGLGIRAGGGIGFSPLLMEDGYYADEVLGKTWGGIADPGYHGTPHPMGIGGPTIEYYTKLSHFSVGAEADVFYAVGFDLGLNATGFLKYTF
jgi:hypothetical protein